MAKPRLAAPIANRTEDYSEGTAKFRTNYGLADSRRSYLYWQQTYYQTTGLVVDTKIPAGDSDCS